MNYNPSLRYENIYEQIKDEPIYRNVNGGSARVYGRLNVIGHGIGRIERHLSSSCGNIDHYNLGGHYAVLGHSHFGTVGHIRLNTTSGVSGAPNAAGLAQQKDNNVKNSSSSFFSCLGGENSQSMNNIYRATGGGGGSAGQGQQRENMNTLHGTSVSNRPSTSAAALAAAAANGTLSRQTATIPKMKQTSKLTPTSIQSTAQTAPASQNAAAKPPTSPEHSSTLNRISKSSLQWLLVNKWLPLWVGQGPDCKVIDFNFMFSRNCDGCDYTTTAGAAVPIPQPLPQDIVRFNGRAEMHARRDPSGRPLRSTLSRLKESELPCRQRIEENNYENVHVHWQNGFEFGRSRDNQGLQPEPSSSSRPTLTRARSESPNFSQRMRKQRKDAKYSDPFKNYELNTENNTFKPRSSGARERYNGTYGLREDSSADEFQATACVETVSIEADSIEIAAAAVLIEAPVVLAAPEEPLDPDGIVVVEEIDLPNDPTQD